MSNSGLVNYTKISPNRTVPREGNIKNIVVHHMAGNLTIETCGNVFAPTSRQASSNYGIGSDGRIGLYCPESDRAWTTGDQIDHESVTIEVADDKIGSPWHSSDNAMQSLVKLCADICKRNGITKLNYTGDKTGNLLMHKWYQKTDCPGQWLGSQFPWIASEVNKLLSGTVTDPDGEITKGGVSQSGGDTMPFGKVGYSVHARGDGWMNWQADGAMAGTTGQNRRIEAIKIKPVGQMDVTVHIKSDGDKRYTNVTKDTIIGTTGQKKRIEAVKIESKDTQYLYRVHQSTYGWSDWKQNGEFAGVKGKSKAVQAVEIKMADILIRGHVQSVGWQTWKNLNETVGTTGKGKRLEAIQINPFGKHIEASAHIQGKGWVDYGTVTKDTIIGTVGEAERLECLRLKGDISYRAHVQGAGCTAWTKADGKATIGTVGQSLRIEAIQIR